jgi:hypothetical protein
MTSSAANISSPDDDGPVRAYGNGSATRSIRENTKVGSCCAAIYLSNCMGASICARMSDDDTPVRAYG